MDLGPGRRQFELDVSTVGRQRLPPHEPAGAEPADGARDRAERQLDQPGDVLDQHRALRPERLEGDRVLTTQDFERGTVEAGDDVTANELVHVDHELARLQLEELVGSRGGLHT